MGGKRVVAVLGDLSDRGADLKALLELIRRLQCEALVAGGLFLLVLGNHDVYFTLSTDPAVVKKREAYLTFKHVDFKQTDYDSFGGVEERAKALDPNTGTLGSWWYKQPVQLLLKFPGAKTSYLLSHAGEQRRSHRPFHPPHLDTDATVHRRRAHQHVR